MSTTLTNGIIIPDNGSRNWGGDLANNWNILDVNVGYMNDVKTKVTTLENSVAENTANIQTNASNISALQTSKQDVIEDLETIRDGASAGATAVQPSELSNYYTKTEMDTALTSKANDSDVVHKSGDETINGQKKFTSEIVNLSPNAFRNAFGDYGTFWRQDEKNLYLLLTNSGDPYGGWNDFRPLMVNLATGICNINGTAGGVAWANVSGKPTNVSQFTNDSGYITSSGSCNYANSAGSANDPNAVHKSGDETISGVKNFKDVVVGEQSGMIRIGNNAEGNLFCTVRYDGQIYNVSKQFVPQTNNEYNLGTSSNKWKTLNGLNPGALSLPKYDQYVTLAFQLNAQIQATFAGFLQVKANVSTGAYLIVTINNVEVVSVSPSANTGHILVPVNKNDEIYVSVTGGEYLGYGSLIIFKAQGNV